MTTEMARLTGTGQTQRLDPYAGGVAVDGARVDALAVISCGYRDEATAGRPGLPRASRREDERQIHLHDPLDRAPGLRAALEASGYRSLLITFPLEEGFLIQRFTRYSASRLEVYGDETALTWIDARQPDQPVHRRFEAGSREYAELVKSCKADTRIYFALAEWGADGPEVVFPDGLGFYALRTTSRHSVRSIQSTLDYTRRFTRRVAGLPFVLSVDHREVAGPDGRKRLIPVWTITTRPPEGIRLSSRTFSELASRALSQGAALMLPAPDAGSWEDAERAGPPPIDEPSEEELRTLEAGGLCDADHYTRLWHALARGTRFEAEHERHALIARYTQGACASLAAYLDEATEAQASDLIATLATEVAADRAHEWRGKYTAVFGTEADWDRPIGATTAVISGRPESSAAEPTPVEAPAAEAEEDPLISSVRDRRYQRYAALVHEAAALDVPFEPITLPLRLSALTALGRDLRDRLDEARAAQTLDEATVEQAEALEADDAAQETLL